jgi:hypothetical protein
MMTNNWQRMNIWLKLNNRFDYAEFTEACAAADCKPQPVLEFAQKAGIVTSATVMYPELPVAEAYLKFIQDNQVAFTPIAQQSMNQPVHQQVPGELPPGYKKEKVTITFADGRTEEQEIVMPDGTRQGCCGGGQVK